MAIISSAEKVLDRAIKPIIDRLKPRKLEDGKLFDVPDALQPKVLEAQFLGVADELHSGMDESEVSDAIHDRARQYLEDNGIHEADDPDLFDKNYHLIRHIAYHNRDKWNENDDTIGKTPQQYVLDDLDRRYVQPARDASYRAMEEHNEEFDDLDKATGDIAKRYGELLAKRANKVGLFERTGKLEATRHKLDDMIAAMATEIWVKNERLIADGNPAALSEDDARLAIDQFIDEQTTLYIGQMEQYRLQKSADRSRVVKFVTEKWASWTPEEPAQARDHRLLSWKGIKDIGSQIKRNYTSKEHLKGNAKKAAVMMGATALLGAVAAPVGAAVGVGAITGAGIAGFVASRAGRAYALQKFGDAASAEKIATKQRQDIESLVASFRTDYEAEEKELFSEIDRLDGEIAAAEASGDDETFEKLRAEREALKGRSGSFHEQIAELTEAKAGAYRSWNQKRLMAGIAMGVAFGTIGSALGHVGADFAGGRWDAAKTVVDNSRDVASRTANSLMRFGSAGQPADADLVSVGSGVNEGRLPSTGYRGVYPVSGPPQGNVPLIGDEAPFKDVDRYISSHHAGEVVGRGEGWYKTFGELGVDKGHQSALLKELGPQLVDRGVAYERGGQFFISKPGELPRDITKLIVERAHGNGWLRGESAAATDALSHISKGEGVLQSLRDAGVENPTLKDVANIGPALEQAGVGYDAPQLGGTGLNYDGGTMSPEGMQLFQDFADNRLLDQSNLDTAITQGNVDQIVQSFAAEHGLSDTPSLDSMIADPQIADTVVPGMSKVVLAGDINRDGSLLDEMKDYLMKSATNKIYFNDALSDAANAHNFSGLGTFQSVIDVAGKELSDIHYPESAGGGPVAILDQRSGHFVLQANGNNLPEAARQLLQKTAIKTDYGLAA